MGERLGISYVGDSKGGRGNVFCACINPYFYEQLNFHLPAIPGIPGLFVHHVELSAPYCTVARFISSLPCTPPLSAATVIGVADFRTLRHALEIHLGFDRAYCRLFAACGMSMRSLPYLCLAFGLHVQSTVQPPIVVVYC